MLNLARRDIAERLDLNLVDDGVEDALAGTKALADEDRHDHALLVLVALVTETDRDRLAAGLDLVGDQRAVKHQRVHVRLPALV